MLYRCMLITIFYLWSNIVLASYKLENFPHFKTCPFIHDDSYGSDINRFIDVIQSHLNSKIQGHQICYAAFNNISQNMNSINDLFNSSRNPNLFEDINDEILSKQLLQLELDLILETPTSSAYQEIASQIRSIENNIYSNNISKTFNRDYFRETRDTQALASTFMHMNEVVNTMSTIPPQCVELLGGWEAIVPTILNSVSSLSGLSGFAYSAIIGAGLKLISSLTVLLQDLNVKTALRDIVRHKNNKVLACTYFSVQNTACEYKRALNFSNDEEKIKELIQQKYSDQDTRIYDRYFTLLEHSRDFQKIFFDISAMGSAISFDTDLITKYFVARRSRPETILDSSDIGPPPPEDDLSEEMNRLRQEWLMKVKERGINFQKKSIIGPNHLIAQIREALIDISLKKADIQGVEDALAGRRSFVDLKHELDTDPNLLDKVDKFIHFFKLVLEEKIVPTQKKGVIAEALKMMLQLKSFLSVTYDEFEVIEMVADSRLGETEVISSFTKYSQKVNEEGSKLFGSMAEGAIAQISSQTVLTVGKTVQDRISRVFRLLEEEFLNAELENNKKEKVAALASTVKYSEYKRDRSLLLSVALNYQMFVGNYKTFRSEDVNVAISTLEKGFSKEIKRMVSSSLKSKSDFYPSLNGQTASHLCALYSMYFKKQGFLSLSTKKIYNTCKKNYKSLELLKITTPEKLDIDWEDPCYYFNYRRILSTQRSLYNKMLSLGFRINSDEQTISPTNETLSF